LGHLTRKNRPQYDVFGGTLNSTLLLTEMLKFSLPFQSFNGIFIVVFISAPNIHHHRRHFDENNLFL